ncbi:vWA domain-containing protein [Desertihabitans aurantiacus]|uniref:vWA domain-containing protein n=1 Tax=Desertihabitans aurantiacus TaxID=2282477 RepID=UPI0018E5260D|nr:VWA domain-containing protein [Desertihabitans aurantiacus]
MSTRQTRQDRRRLSPLVWWLTLGALLSSAVLGTAPRAWAEEETSVLLLLDVSGSMNEEISSGGTKLAAAKEALKEVADELPAGTRVGLRVYGSEIAAPQEEDPRACEDSELVLPVGPLDRDAMYEAVDSFEAVGETPIAYSMQQAVKDLGTEGNRVLVLISDGEENCVPDPCPVAEELAGSGVDLQFNAIGLDVGAEAREQLQCIAEAGGGSYYDADESEELSDSIDKLTTRALRPFTLTGTPVRGGAGETDAAAINAGQYVDTLPAGREPSWYRIERRPGSTVRVSLAAVVTAIQGMTDEAWQLELRTASGQRCDQRSSFDISYLGSEITTAGVTAGPDDESERADACATEPLLLAVTRTSPRAEDEIGVELVVDEEAPVVDQASLPDPVTSYDGSDSEGDPVEPSGGAEEVVGGVSFSNAAELTDGSSTDDLATGETLVYRVPLQPGQRLSATVEFPQEGSPWELGNFETATGVVRLLAPGRQQLVNRYTVLQGDRTDQITVSSPEVRIRNRESGQTQIAAASVAGDYYLLVTLGTTNRDTVGRLMEVRINLDVEGEPSGLPEYEEAEPDPTPTPAASAPATPAPPEPSTPAPSGPDETGGPGAGVVAAVATGTLLAVGLVVGLAVWLLRRGRPQR